MRARSTEEAFLREIVLDFYLHARDFLENYSNRVVKISLHVIIRVTDKMDSSSILFIIHTIGTILNFNGCNNGHRLKTLRVNTL